MKSLHDKRSCVEFLEKYRWQGVPICPHCNCQSDKHYKLTFNGEFNGLYKCRECKKRFTVTTGTMFHGSNVPLEKWFYAIYVFLSHKKGISSIQLSKDIDVTQKTAWAMLTKIRCNLSEPLELNSLDDVTQVDEVYFNPKPKGRIWQNRDRSPKESIPVVGLLTNDKVITFVIDDVDSNTLHGIIYAMVKLGSIVVTDGLHAYRGIRRDYNHQIVIHSKGNYVNKDGFHTNGIEGFWSHLKRGIKGIYHSVSRKHLQIYCDEFAYKYSTRKMTDIERFMKFITSTHKRLRYSEITYPML